MVKTLIYYTQIYVYYIINTQKHTSVSSHFSMFCIGLSVTIKQYNILINNFIFMYILIKNVSNCLNGHLF